MEIKKVGVLGCGLMGAGIAQTAASAGFETTVREVSEELLQKGFTGIEKSLEKFAAKGIITAKEQKATRDRLIVERRRAEQSIAPRFLLFGGDDAFGGAFFHPLLSPSDTLLQNFFETRYHGCL